MCVCLWEGAHRTKTEVLFCYQLTIWQAINNQDQEFISIDRQLIIPLGFRDEWVVLIKTRTDEWNVERPFNTLRETRRPGKEKGLSAQRFQAESMKNIMPQSNLFFDFVWWFSFICGGPRGLIFHNYESQVMLRSHLGGRNGARHTWPKKEIFRWTWVP